MKLLFFGSPAFAVPTLRALCQAGHQILCVITQPDRPRGRSGRPVPTPVKEAALELGLHIYQPQDVNASESVAHLKAIDADLGVVAAFGAILSPQALAVTKQGFLNVHASLLPGYRGAAPINWAIMRGETRTGVTIIRMVPRLDAGPILAQRETAIGPDETAGELEARLAVLGAELAAEVVGRMARGEAVAGRPQPSKGGFFARKLTKNDGKVDWNQSAGVIRNWVRGLTPWPGAYADYIGARRNCRVILLEVREEPQPSSCVPASPGQVVAASRDGLLVAAASGLVRIVKLKPAGGRAMAGEDFVRGYGIRPGDKFR